MNAGRPRPPRPVRVVATCPECTYGVGRRPTDLVGVLLGDVLEDGRSVLICGECGARWLGPPLLVLRRYGEPGRLSGADVLRTLSAYEEKEEEEPDLLEDLRDE
jgi:hypothetical protein